MARILQNIAFILSIALFICAPIEMKAESFLSSPFEMEQNGPSVSVTESTIHVKNADRMTLEIFNITGKKIYTTRIDGSSKDIEVDNLSRGWYIVRIGECQFIRKIYIK